MYRSQYLDADEYYDLATYVILYYDYFLVLNDEVKYFWKSKFSWTTPVLLATRYIALLGYIPIIFQSLHASPLNQRICDHLVFFHECLIVLIQILVGVLLITRVYALTHRSKTFLRTIIVTSIVCIGAASLTVTVEKSSVSGSHDILIDQDAGTRRCLTISSPKGARLLGLTWIGVVVFDVVNICFTLLNVRDVMKTGGDTLTAVLIRDGVIYFLILTFANISSIVSYFIAPIELQGISTNFASVISVTMISRLMINMKKQAADIPTVYMYADAGVSAVLCPPGGQRTRGQDDIPVKNMDSSRLIHVMRTLSWEHDTSGSDNLDQRTVSHHV